MKLRMMMVMMKVTPAARAQEVTVNRQCFNKVCPRHSVHFLLHVFCFCCDIKTMFSEFGSCVSVLLHTLLSGFVLLFSSSLVLCAMLLPHSLSYGEFVRFCVNVGSVVLTLHLSLIMFHFVCSSLCVCWLCCCVWFVSLRCCSWFP